MATTSTEGSRRVNYPLVNSEVVKSRNLMNFFILTYSKY